MVSDGMATIGAETLDGKECTTYSVFDNDNKLIRKMWVDNQTGIIFKRYGYTVIDDKENTSTYEYTTTLTLLSGQEAPKMPDYSTALFTNKIYSDSEWTDDMLISPSVVKAENFDSFEIAVYSDTLATFAFYGENVGLADNPEELPGYVSLGNGSTYRFYDEQTGESFTLNVNYGDNGYGIKILPSYSHRPLTYGACSKGSLHYILPHFYRSASFLPILLPRLHHGRKVLFLRDRRLS